MISLKELKFVSALANQSPYPGEQYALETLQSLKDAVLKYEEKYKEKEYSMVFSDASELNFKILDVNVCHMLGIDFQTLINGEYDYFFKKVLSLDKQTTKISSYHLINAIINNYQNVAEYDAINDKKIINYYKVRIKCGIFDKMSDFEKFNFIKLNANDNQKILFTQSNEVNCPYFLTRLTETFPESYNKIYCVNSLLAIQNSKIPFYFQEQASIPTQILIDTNKELNKLEATPKEKIDLLNMYKNIILTNNLNYNMDISGDYMSLLTQMDTKIKTLKK